LGWVSCQDATLQRIVDDRLISLSATALGVKGGGGGDKPICQ